MRALLEKILQIRSYIRGFLLVLGSLGVGELVLGVLGVVLLSFGALTLKNRARRYLKMGHWSTGD